jgi:hypothetical protein
MNSNNSNTNASAAKVSRSHGAKNSRVARIADAIVDLVERTSGPVFLHEIDDQVPGFRARGPRGYIYFIQRNGKETVYWAGMTTSGFKALQSVLNDRRVAVQYVSYLPYFFDGAAIDVEGWQPIALLPSRAANLSTSKWDLRVSPEAQQIAVATGKARPLIPRSVRFTADQFSAL